MQINFATRTYLKSEREVKQQSILFTSDCKFPESGALQWGDVYGEERGYNEIR